MTLAQFAPGQFPYAVSCGGSPAASITVSVIAPAALDNRVPLVVDQGVGSAGASNQSYITVNVCAPGTASCQTIDHVLVDTVSVGLRLLASRAPGPGQPRCSGSAQRLRQPQRHLHPLPFGPGDHG
ncbi:MAG: DUF3443 family protein, partial [Acidobacteriota bacterium]|nr:DUF3443 family protein [Acidobacteriota bacterium]